MLLQLAMNEAKIRLEGSAAPPSPTWRTDMADDRVAELETICAELHVIIGALAAEAGVYDHPEVSKALDNASECRLVHKDL